MLIAGVASLALAGCRGGREAVANAGFEIPGAPGYGTFAGDRGDPLPVGRPWGRACQPIRLSVEDGAPDWVYSQVAAVVGEAREEGIDVTLETPQFRWYPAALYYIDGQSPRTTMRVAIFPHYQTPPQLASGHPEHVGLGWDTRLDPDGHNEDLTLAQADLWMRTINGNPEAVRKSIRYVIAMTQGVITSSLPESSIAPGGHVDHFTPADVAAMKLMSGCGNAGVSP